MTTTVGRLGIVAGGGGLPLRLAEGCEQAGMEIFLIAFAGQTDPVLLEGRRHLLARPGAGGAIINMLKQEGISDIVFIGSVRRPSLSELRPDIRTALFLARTGFRALGDDGLLKAMRAELEREGFRIHGVQDFIPDMLAPAGTLGKTAPGPEYRADIVRGIEVSRKLGEADVGQSVVVQEGIVLGVEAAEGTDILIERCGEYKRRGRGSVLVKLAKPGQDRSLDLPVIGGRTVGLCARSGFAGIAVHAGNTLILDVADTVAEADRHGLFIEGVNPFGKDYEIS